MSSSYSLQGCGIDSPLSSEGSSTGSTPAESQAALETPTAPETPLNPVNPADLPDCFPAELPMPAGDYRWATIGDDGVFLSYRLEPK
jgi:hypothetical protein